MNMDANGSEWPRGHGGRLRQMLYRIRSRQHGVCWCVSVCVQEVAKHAVLHGAHVLPSLLPSPHSRTPIRCPPRPTHAGRYAFVELRTEDLATHAMLLDKTELAGRPMNIGRPKGYIPPMEGAANNAKLGLVQQFAAQLSGGVTNVLLLDNLVHASAVRDDDQRKEVGVLLCCCAGVVLSDVVMVCWDAAGQRGGCLGCEGRRAAQGGGRLYVPSYEIILYERLIVCWDAGAVLV